MDKVKGLRGFEGIHILPGILIIFFMWALFSGHEALAGEPDAAGTAITITSESMKADRTSKIVVFKGDVEAREDFLLCSDELHMSYADSNEVTKIDARGHVRIYRASGVARSERAIYDRVAHTLLLTGGALIERCSDTVKGDKITLYLDDDSVLVEGANNGRVRAVIIPDNKCAGDGDDKKSGAGTGAANGVFDAKGINCKSAR